MKATETTNQTRKPIDEILPFYDYNDEVAPASTHYVVGDSSGYSLIETDRFGCRYTPAVHETETIREMADFVAARPHISAVWAQ